MHVHRLPRCTAHTYRDSKTPGKRKKEGGIPIQPLTRDMEIRALPKMAMYNGALRARKAYSRFSWLRYFMHSFLWGSRKQSLCRHVIKVVQEVMYFSQWALFIRYLREGIDCDNKWLTITSNMSASHWILISHFILSTSTRWVLYPNALVVSRHTGF